MVACWRKGALLVPGSYERYTWEAPVTLGDRERPGVEGQLVCALTSSAHSESPRKRGLSFPGRKRWSVYYDPDSADRMVALDAAVRLVPRILRRSLIAQPHDPR